MIRPRKSMFTDEQLASIFAWRRANKSYTFIARRVGASNGAVRHQCLIAAVFPIGIPPRTSTLPMLTSRGGVPVRRFTAEEDALILAMDADDIGATEIGRATGRTAGTIRNRILTLTMRELQEQAA